MVIWYFGSPTSFILTLYFRSTMLVSGGRIVSSMKTFACMAQL
jgi:hypothetical protein